MGLQVTEASLEEAAQALGFVVRSHPPLTSPPGRPATKRSWPRPHPKLLSASVATSTGGTGLPCQVNTQKAWPDTLLGKTLPPLERLPELCTPVLG